MMDPEKLVCSKTDGTIFNFNTFKNSLDFASDLYHKGKTSLKDAKKFQYKMFGLLNDFEKYEPKKLKKIKSKEALMQRSCIITGIKSLRHLKMDFFDLVMDFKKKRQVCLINHYQIG